MLEQPADIADRLNITEDEVIDYILEAQQRAQEMAEAAGFDIVKREELIEEEEDDFSYDLEFLLGELNKEDDEEDEDDDWTI